MKAKAEIHDQFLETLAPMINEAGQSKTGAKIFAHLLIVEEIEQTFEDIVEAVNASKSTVSVELNKMIDQEIIVANTPDKGRKRTFSVNLRGWAKKSIENIKSTIANELLLNLVLAYRSKESSPEFYEQLNGMNKIKASCVKLAEDMFSEYFENRNLKE